jgi:hypothetical protein
MKPAQNPYYTLLINELRIKQPISTTFSHFYDPVALIVLVVVAKSIASKEFILMPNKSNPISKYITFIEKNNERVLKKIPIDYIFKEFPKNGVESLFFLIEMDNQLFTLSEISQQIDQVSLMLNLSSSKNLTDPLLVTTISSLFKQIDCSNLFLLKEKTLISVDPFSITTSNDLISLEATIKLLL